MTNPYASATPEQKLSILSAELLTPIEVIGGFAQLMKKDIETNNINPDEMLERINVIIDKVEWIKELREDIIKA